MTEPKGTAGGVTRGSDNAATLFERATSSEPNGRRGDQSESLTTENRERASYLSRTAAHPGSHPGKGPTPKPEKLSHSHEETQELDSRTRRSRRQMPVLRRSQERTLPLVQPPPVRRRERPAMRTAPRTPRSLPTPITGAQDHSLDVDTKNLTISPLSLSCTRNVVLPR